MPNSPDDPSPRADRALPASPSSNSGKATPPRDRRRGRRKWRYVLGLFIILLLCAPTVFAAWQFIGVRFPSPAEVTSRPVLMLEAVDGTRLVSKGEFQLPPVSAKDMPGDVVNAVLSIEDKRFYQRGAIDPRSMLRAFIENERAGQVVAGGSTITQQLAKILFLDPQRTYRRKIQEAAIAIWLNLHLSKEQILTSYLNNVYLGAGAIGFPAAAKLYFSKNVNDLTLSEAAMLAGMISAPVHYDPLHDLSAARARAATVLDAMVANGKLTRDAALVAKLRPATPNPTELSPVSDGWFADWVHDRAASVISGVRGIVRVRTTLDPQLQELAQSIVDSTLARYGTERHATQAALIAMRPDGAVVAMVGGRNYAESQFNRAVEAQRQPGSAFKLFDYYAALRKGFSLDDEVEDEPIDIRGWQPDNYGRRYHGRVTLADAFAHSLNAATVRLSQEVGVDQVIAAARDLGLRAPLADNPSLVLGTSEVSLLDLTSAYAAVRAGVAPVDPWGIASISLSGGKVSVPVGRPDEPRHTLEQYQSQLIDLLRGVVEYGTGRAAALNGFAAGKTGTSQDFRDAWFIGFNDSLVVGVWVGNDDHSPMKEVAGGTLPAMIWKQFMEQSNSPTVTAVNEQPQTPREPSEGAVAVSEEPAQTSGRQQAWSERANEGNAAAENEGRCDIPACDQYYHSFRVSDCTYQPYVGPRRYCDR